MTKIELCSLIMLFILVGATVFGTRFTACKISTVRELEHHGHKISADQNLPRAVAQLAGCYWVQGCGESSRPLQYGRLFWDCLVWLTLCIQHLNWLIKRPKVHSNIMCQIKLNCKSHPGFCIKAQHATTSCHLGIIIYLHCEQFWDIELQSFSIP